MKKILILAIFISPAISFGQTKLTVQTPNEPWGIVFSNARNTVITNHGLQASRTNGGSKNGEFYTIRAFLGFDLSSVPVGSKVNWARLTFFGGGSSIDLGPNASILRRITSPCEPSTLTWDNQPTTAVRGAVKLPESTSHVEDYKNIDVWSLVQAMVDSPSTSYGFALRLDTDLRGTTERDLSFEQPLSSAPHKAPKLVMEYTPPGLVQKTTSLSIGIDGEETQLNIYPNPCHGTFSFDLQTGEQQNLNLKVIDLLGKIIYSQPVESISLHKNISLPSSLAGIYFVVLQTERGIILSQELQVN